MAKYLQDVSISTFDKGHAEQLAGSTNFLRLLYLDCLPKWETNPIAKVVLTPCSVLPESPLKLLVNPDVVQLSKTFDFDAYRKGDKEARKRIALDFLQEGLLEVARIKGWDTKPLRDAYKAVLAKKLIDKRPWSKPVSSPNRKHKAQVWCNFDSDKAEIYLVITTKGEAVEFPLTTVEPGDVWIRKAIGELKWIGPDKLRFTTSRTVFPDTPRTLLVNGHDSIEIDIKQETGSYS